MVLRELHFGIGVRRGQTDLLQWLNTFIYAIKNNGELDAISRKWRELPLGDLPVSDAQRTTRRTWCSRRKRAPRTPQFLGRHSSA